MANWIKVMVFIQLVCFCARPAWAERGFLLMASTIGPIDAGIVGALEEGFEKETGIRVRHVGAGTGEALKIAQQGSVDIVLVHAKSLEEKFVAEGFGTERIPLMYNDFVIVGPKNDPAGIRGMTSAIEALRQISAMKAAFITRGDKSGTHVAELELWQKAGLTPAPPWYKVFEKGSEGNIPTLQYADSQQAYTLIDRATYLTLRNGLALDVLVEGDDALLNRMSLIPVNPKKFDRVNNKDALVFVTWLTDPQKGQKIIEQFGRERYGSPLFFPDSKQWHERSQVGNSINR